MSDSTRRDFLKTSTSAAVGAALAGSLSSRAYAASDETIKVGLVGCGGRGSKAAIQALRAPGNVKLIAIGDAFRDQIDVKLKGIETETAGDDTAMVDVPEERKFVGFDAYQKVIDSGVDLVILATPPGFRPIHFEYAINAGKHVFMEKPVAVDSVGVRQVLEASRKAKQQNLKVGVGLQRRHKGSYLEMVDRVHNGAIGDIAALRVYWNGGGVWEPRRSREEVATEMEYQMRNWYYYNWLCGDHICEQHIHNLDVGCWLKGDQFPVKAIGMGGRQVRTDKRYGEIFDHHACQFTFEDGSVMISECRHIRGCWGSVTEHIHGTKGLADLTNNKTMKYTTSTGDEWEYYSGDRANRRKWTEPDAYQVEHDDLNTAIRNDIAYNEADYGAKSTMTAILGRMCTYSGKEISWDDAIASKIALRPETYAWDAMPPTVPNENGEYPIPVPGYTKVL
jgi:predicted dehydrogenase